MHSGVYLCVDLLCSSGSESDFGGLHLIRRFKEVGDSGSGLRDRVSVACGKGASAPIAFQIHLSVCALDLARFRVQAFGGLAEADVFGLLLGSSAPRNTQPFDQVLLRQVLRSPGQALPAVGMPGTLAKSFIPGHEDPAYCQANPDQKKQLCLAQQQGLLVFRFQGHQQMRAKVAHAWHACSPVMSIEGVERLSRCWQGSEVQVQALRNKTKHDGSEQARTDFPYQCLDSATL